MTFDITYVRIIFESPRPESWAIYKKKNENSPWEPYQYYSATCRDTYGLPELKETVRGDDTRVLCTSEYSDIVPLSKGTVAFSTLEGRPSAYNFETNPDLQVSIYYNFFFFRKIETMNILTFFYNLGIRSSDWFKNHFRSIKYFWR